MLTYNIYIYIYIYICNPLGPAPVERRRAGVARVLADNIRDKNESSSNIYK